MSIDRAIAKLEGEIALQGTKDQPKEGTEEWYLFRVSALGLSFLRKLKAEGGNAEAAYKKAMKGVKGKADDEGGASA